MVVERGQSVRQSTIGPGVRVRAKARIFGEEYAKELFGKRWRSGELPGVVERAVGKNEWSVRCAALPDARIAPRGKRRRHTA